MNHLSVSLAAGLTESSNVFAPLYGRGVQGGADEKALLASVQLELSSRTIAPPFRVYPAEGCAPARLYLGEGVAGAPLVRQFAIFAAVGMRRQGAQADLGAAYLYALHGVLPQSVMRAPGEYAAAVWELASVDALWEAISLDELLEMHNELIRVVVPHPRPADAAEVEARARELYARAKTLRRLADYEASEAAYGEFERLAEYAEAWDLYAAASLGRALIHAQRGADPAARREYAECLRRARRHELRSTEAMANHGLAVLEARSGAFALAEELFLQACLAYQPRDAGIVRLAGDTVGLWLDQGAFSPAIEVLPLIVALSDSTELKVLFSGNLARACGGAGDRAGYEKAVRSLHMWSSAAQTEEFLADATLCAARGAASLGMWDRAEQATWRAVAIATRRDENRVVFAGESLVAYCRARRRMGFARADTETSEAPPSRQALRIGLVKRLGQRLREREVA